MKRALVIVAVAAATACSSREKNYSSAPSSATADRESSTTVIQPSELSPEQVRLVQRALSDRGFAVELTGDFDNRTETALMGFQRARGLPATGNLNSPTVEGLGIDPRDVMPVRRGDTMGAGPSREENEPYGTGQGPESTGAPPPTDGK